MEGEVPAWQLLKQEVGQALANVEGPHLEKLFSLFLIIIILGSTGWAIHL